MALWFAAAAVPTCLLAGVLRWSIWVVVAAGLAAGAGFVWTAAETRIPEVGAGAFITGLTLAALGPAAVLAGLYGIGRGLEAANRLVKGLALILLVGAGWFALFVVLLFVGGIVGCVEGDGPCIYE